MVRRISLILSASACAVFFLACSSEQEKECISDAECPNGVCVQEKCFDCRIDGDCAQGYECVRNVCNEILTETCEMDSCNSHGTCDDSTGSIVCTCDIGYTSDHCGICDTGFIDNGEGVCLPDPCIPNPCNGHGTCASGTCTCDQSYVGIGCDACAPGSFGTYPNCFLASAGHCESNQCFPIPPTNQVECYDGDASITCTDFPCAAEGSPAFCGQDAQYPDNARVLTCTYTDGSVQDPCDPSADEGEMVVDSLTGLVWQRTWVGNVNWQNAIATCDNLVYGGYDDWRLPNPLELISIVDHGRWDPAFDPVVFPGTPSGVYGRFWTSTPLAEFPRNTWLLYNTDGIMDFEDGTTFYKARCVRSELNAFTGGDHRFVILEAVPDQPVVLDITTGLVWQKNHVSGLNWERALSTCEGLTYSGFDDWRLPDKKELVSLANYGRINPASDFPQMPDDLNFWSSTSKASNSRAAWSLHFYYGKVGTLNKNGEVGVRCVR